MINNLAHTLSNPHYTGKGDWLVNKFEDFAYHEVAHAVDDKTGYMDTHGSEPDHGGWEKSSRDEVVKLACGAKGFYAAFPSYPREFLRRYLEIAGVKKKPESNDELLSVGRRRSRTPRRFRTSRRS